MNRINIVTLGVRNMARSVRFYRDGLGFKTNERADAPQVIFFHNNGAKLELYSLAGLAEDAGAANPPEAPGGFAGITLAYNAKRKEEVCEIVELARKAGAVITKEPQDAFWGGYHGYFADPDGYYWEVAFDKTNVFDEQDMLVFPETDGGDAV
jgi:catechol 2,3-dioxygenase-like lactoylglutathione lyase family enzyme